MHAEIFTVANAGQVRDGLLSMVSGGWEGCEITQFPGQVNLVLVGVIVYAPEDCGRSHVIRVAVNGGDRTGAFGTIQVTPSTVAPVVKTPFALALSLTVEGPVVLSLTATVEDGPTFGPTQFEVRSPRADQRLDVPSSRPDRLRYSRAGDSDGDGDGSTPASEVEDEFDWLQWRGDRVGRPTITFGHLMPGNAAEAATLLRAYLDVAASRPGPPNAYRWAFWFWAAGRPRTGLPGVSSRRYRWW